MRRSKQQAQEIHSEIDRRVLKFQPIHEICSALDVGYNTVLRHIYALDMETHRITPQERDLLLSLRLAKLPKDEVKP